jgi:hypothetical protein
MRGGVEMREMRHNKPGVRSETPRELNRREFFKLGGAGLVAGLAVASGAGTLLFPKTAHARQREVGGQTLTVVQLDRTLNALDQETERRYQRQEHQPSDRNGHTYQSAVTVPETVTVLVTLNETRSQRDLSVSARTLPRPVGTAIDDFAGLVQSVTNQPLRRVKIVLERGTFRQGEQDVEYTNGYILPVNSEGQVTSHLGNGEYLMYGVSQFGSTVQSDPAVVAEPNRQASLPIASRRA